VVADCASNPRHRTQERQHGSIFQQATAVDLHDHILLP
jgi:hypothetical protein